MFLLLMLLPVMNRRQCFVAHEASSSHVTLLPLTDQPVLPQGLCTLLSLGSLQEEVSAHLPPVCWWPHQMCPLSLMYPECREMLTEAGSPPELWSSCIHLTSPNFVFVQM